jgi:DNA-binding response OmpR family regulator
MILAGAVALGATGFGPATQANGPEKVLSRDSLLDLTHGRSSGSFDRSIDVPVNRVRRKIESDPQIHCFN